MNDIRIPDTGFHRGLRLTHGQKPGARLTARAILMCMLITGARAGAQELRVIESDAAGCTIEYVPRIRFDEIRTPDAVYAKPVFDQAAPVGASVPGEPSIAFRPAMIALPALEGNRVTVVEADYEERTGIRIAPFPGEKETQDGTELTYVEGQTYSVDGFLPASAADLDAIGIARDLVVGTARLFPLQWNPARRTARIYSRLVIRIDFAATRSVKARSRDEQVTLDVVNPALARQWKWTNPSPLSKGTPFPRTANGWYRIQVDEEGIYRLDKAWFQNAGIDLSSVDPRTIRIFGTGGKELPQNLANLRQDEVRELAIQVIGEADGRFDDNDHVIFYGQPLGGFVYDSAARRYRHQMHRYDRANAVLLTFGGTNGKRMASTESVDDPVAYQVSSFTGKEYVEEETLNLMNSGKLWLSRKIDPRLQQAGAIAYSKKLQDIDPSKPVIYRMRLYSQADFGVTSSFSVTDAGPLGTIAMDYTPEGNAATSSGIVEFQRRGDLADGRSTVTIGFSASDPDKSRGGYVDWVEWYYARRLLAVGDMLAFSAPDTTAVVSYELNGFTNSDILLYRITEFDAVEQFTNPIRSGGTLRFQHATREGKPEQYLALAGGQIKTPPAPKLVEPAGLRELPGAEFVIITSPELKPAANTLKAFRERPGDDYISTQVVTTNDIFLEFNAGIVDPTAIRNFLAYAMDSWSVKPRYVLFLGDGHFDYKNYTTKELHFVPVWETENSIDMIGSYPTDDYFVQVVGNDSRVDIASGRIPVQSLSSAEAVVRKIIDYQSNQEFGAWRNRVVLVADDGITSGGNDYAAHTSQSEDLARTLPIQVEQEKIYIVAYRTEISAQGRRKPDANRSIIDDINDGAVVINYTGHGSDCVWAHEQIFVCDGTIPQLRNEHRQTFVCAATCTFGLYDRPDVRSGTEALILKPDGGAIGGLSSPRVVYSGQNSAFNLAFFNAAISKGREQDGRMKRVGDGLYAAKQILYGDPGYEKFHLFGDPTIRLVFPRYTASVDDIRINDSSVVADTIRFKALSRVTVEGSVRREDNSIWTEFSGTTQVTLLDAERKVPVPEWGAFTFTISGGVLYRGQATIKDGRFTIGFIVPKDISYENNRGRLALYFDNGNTDGAGFNNGFFIGGSDSSASTDSRGPDIGLFVDDRRFRPGDLVGENALLIADLYDANGINTTGLGIGHNIEAWLDGSTNSIVLSSFYKGKIDSYQHGTVEYPMRNLTPGMHTLTLRAWDIYNNSATATTYFSVASTSQLAVQHVVPYPNPMTDRTDFTFQHNLGEPVNVEIKIYSVAGRLIKTIHADEVTERFVRIPWDGRDEDGTSVANGVYFYRLVCRSLDASRTSERLERLSVLK